MLNLFRDEVMQARRLDWLGPVSIATAPNQRFLAICAAVTIVSLLGILCLGHYQRYDHLTGILDYSYPPLDVASPIDGHVARIVVGAGSVVRAGQPIAYVTPEDSVQQAGGEFVITAPQDGQVIATDVSVGEPAVHGRKLFRMRTRGSILIARFPIEANHIIFITQGTAMRLRYHDFPTQQYGESIGKVREVVPNFNLPAGQYPYELTISLSSYTITRGMRPITLTAGLMVETDLALDKRTLLSWLMGRPEGRR